MFGRLFKVVYDGTGRSIIPTQKKKKRGYGTPKSEPFI